MIAQTTSTHREPTAATLRAAKAAANSPHALVNLIRFVGSLQRQIPNSEVTHLTLIKDQQDLEYARILLEAIRNGNEGPSTSSETLNDLERTLNRIEERMSTLSEQDTSIFSISSSPPTPISDPKDSPTVSPLPLPSEARNLSSRSSIIRQRTSVQEYLRRRIEEDRQGGEIGLLPLKIPIKPIRKEDRDILFSGVKGGMGSARLHEELGGQLADMSHRLKLNAVHFANSLEEEKASLDTSTDVLEKNLTATRQSKSNLSKVSKKGRGTTCMTLGVVILVMLLFMWTYMVIRFT
ncbi:hypothetical protein M231_07769 [Tremella mesenterica]|uniref:Uncharacterized protein n=1 Tax=Tremella mesenterica TaxID=5217 RepID=A0A4Q1BB92_TREME|nr:uncharacterized protein TREMEDRAFT_68109 [Tremella mesenterica DSM 1558]EIW70557.1 hypothetical protein TREMEDRAFT_68109 [Tremella mesenterica DSM 1558]RXK34986.1 hypothetical protein M231_07769 [Tremella mesenterica]